MRFPGLRTELWGCGTRMEEGGYRVEIALSMVKGKKGKKYMAAGVGKAIFTDHQEASVEGGKHITYHVGEAG